MRYPVTVLATVITAALIAVGILSASHRSALDEYRHDTIPLDHACGDPARWRVSDVVGVLDEDGNPLPHALRVTCSSTATVNGFPRAIRSIVIRGES